MTFWVCCRLHTMLFFCYMYKQGLWTKGEEEKKEQGLWEVLKQGKEWREGLWAAGNIVVNK